MLQLEACTAIQDAGFSVGAITHEENAVYECGTVFSQTPIAGSTASTGSNVDLLVCLQETFAKTNGGANNDIGCSVQETSDGGCIIAGMTSSFGAGNNDVYLLKTDVNGDATWSNTFGGSGIDNGYCVQKTSDGGFIITGSTDSFGAGATDVYLVKTDVHGDEVWSKTFGGSNDDVGRSVKETSDGGFIVVGETSSFGAGNNDVYLVKTDVHGDKVWSKTFGGTDQDLGTSVQVTSDNGFIVAGVIFSFGAGEGDMYLIKTDAGGNVGWTKTYGGANHESALSVHEMFDGGYIVAGVTESFGAGSGDVYLVKTNASGEMVWEKTYGGTGYDAGHAVREASDGGYIIAADTTSFGAGASDIYLVKTDINGTVVWEETYGGVNIEYAHAVREMTDGSFIVTGGSISFGAGGLDVYLVKTDALGNAPTVPVATSVP